MNIADRLAAGLAELGLTLSSAQQAQLLAYMDLLLKWNRIYNLTAIVDPVAMISDHLLDSLSIAPLITGDRILDVGSGAGLPGIPLAIALSDQHITLLDSLAKRTRFLSHVVTTLSLPNVCVVNERMQTYCTVHRFDTITARALAPCSDIVEATQRLCRPQGQWVLLKGRAPASECVNLPKDTVLQAIEILQVPGLKKVRHSVQILNDV